MGEVGFRLSRHCRRGTSHRTPPMPQQRGHGGHGTQQPNPSASPSSAPLPTAVSNRGRPRGAARPQTRLSRAWLCKPQREPFQLVGLLPGSQVPSSSSSSLDGCQSPVGSCPGSHGCLRPHAEHAVPAMSKGLSLPRVPREVGAGPGARRPPAPRALIPQHSCEPAPSAGFTVLEVSSSVPVLLMHSGLMHTGNQRRGCPCAARTHMTPVALGREQGPGAVQAPRCSRGGDGAVCPIAGELCLALWPCWDFPPCLHPRWDAGTQPNCDLL